MKKKNLKQKSRKEKNIFRIAAICGIFIVIFSILGGIVSALFSNDISVMNMWGTIQPIIVLVLSSIFTYGFYALGRKYNSNFLKIISLVIIIAMILYYILSFIVLNPILEDLAAISLNINNIMTEKALSLGITDINVITAEQQQLLLSSIIGDKSIIEPFIKLFSFFGVTLLVSIVLSILFGVALKRLDKKVRHARVAGILEIVGGATLILFGVGLIIMLIAFVYELIILFREEN